MPSGAREAVLQAFVRPVGLPHKPGQQLRVAAFRANSTAPLAFTPATDRQDPLFRSALELWGDDFGKDAPCVSIFFRVQLCSDSGEQTLAEARTSSTELRKFGLYNPREGAAVSFPLVLPADAPQSSSGGGDDATHSSASLPPDACLHCYLHVGHAAARRSSSGSRASRSDAVPSSVKRSAGLASNVEDRLAAGGERAGGEGTNAGANEDGSCAGGAPQRSVWLRFESALRPLPERPSCSMRLHVRGRSTCPDRAVRLGPAPIELRVAPPWRVHACAGVAELEGAIVPPGGLLELSFDVMRDAACDESAGAPAASVGAEAETAGLTPASAGSPRPWVLCVEHAPLADATADGDGGAARLSLSTMMARVAIRAPPDA